MNAPLFQLLPTEAFRSFTRAWVLASSCLLCTTALPAAPESLRVTARDADSSTVEWLERLTNAVTGEVTEGNHSYVKMGTGLNYQDASGTWRESQDLIELMPDGSAAALRGSLKARFSANLNTEGAVTLTSVSNRVFRSQPLGLYYFEADTGRSTLVGLVKDSVAELHPPNQLVWRDCLDGAGVQADYRVTYTKAGMEADVILLRLPDPKALGITSDSVRLEWFTEWLDLPEPRIRERLLKTETDPGSSSRDGGAGFN